MKLSQMPTEKAMEAMANLIPAISRVAENPKVIALLSAADKETAEQAGLKFFFSLANVLLRECRADALEMVAVLCDKTPEDVAKQSIIATVKDIASCYDKELIDFFRSFRHIQQGP